MNKKKHSLFIRIVALLLVSIFPTTLFAGEVLYYHTDNFGTPMAMTDKNGKVVWRADELPFGEEYETQEIPEHNNRRFLGKQLDKETGLVSMGARYLDPKTGRFTQPDPVGLVDPATGKVNQEMLLNPQRLNRYVYALNNPYKYVDPEGNFAIIGAALIGAAIAYFSHPDIANAPRSSSSPTYRSHGARNIAFGVVGGIATKEVASVLAVSKLTKSLQEQANELIPQNANRNRVTLRSPSQKMEVDLAGKSHDGIPTPHTKISPRNYKAPNQPAYNTKNSPVRAATQEDIRTVRKYLKNRRR